eukprot:jgi/Undpi1/2737/HiC_scaffold_14.g06115.m1
MDADGNCLVVSPCNFCKNSKNGVQSCIVRKHNARLCSVKKANLASRHRQCVKPDQAMTIFKLVDRESGEESVEFARGMVFQRPCENCTHLKTCILAGHTLQDWIPDSGRQPDPLLSPSTQPALVLQHKRKAPQAAKSPKDSQPKTVSSADSEMWKILTIMGCSIGHTKQPERLGGYRVWPHCEAGASSAPTTGKGASRDGCASASPHSIASQLQALAAEEDWLRQQYLADLRVLEEEEAAKVIEIQTAHAALENIRLARKTKQSSKDEERKKMAAERERLTQLRLQEMLQEEAERQKKNEALWGACETAANLSTDAGVEAAVAAAAAAAAEATTEGGDGMETESQRAFEVKHEGDVEVQAQPRVQKHALASGIAGFGEKTGGEGEGGEEELASPGSSAPKVRVAEAGDGEGGGLLSSPSSSFLNISCSTPSVTLEEGNGEAVVDGGRVGGGEGEFDVVNSWALLRGAEDSDAVKAGVVRGSGGVVEEEGGVHDGEEGNGMEVPDISDDDEEEEEKQEEGQEREEEEEEEEGEEGEGGDGNGGGEEAKGLDTGTMPAKNGSEQEGGRGASEGGQENRLGANGWQTRQEGADRKGNTDHLSIVSAAAGACSVTPAQASSSLRRKEAGGGGDARDRKELHRHDEKELREGGGGTGRAGSGGGGGSGRVLMPRSGEDGDGGRGGKATTGMQGSGKRSDGGGGRSTRKGGRHAQRHGGRTVAEAVSA